MRSSLTDFFRAFNSGVDDVRSDDEDDYGNEEDSKDD